jgi:hypothetical protein
MVIDMNETKLKTIEPIREFLTGTADVSFSIPADESTLRAFVSTVIRRFGYFRLTKGQRGIVFAYLRRLTGYSRAHLSRLIAQYRDTRSLKPLARASRTSFAHRSASTLSDLATRLEKRSLTSPETRETPQKHLYTVMQA